MKKILALLLALCCMVGLGACSSQQGQEEKPNGQDYFNGKVLEIHDTYILVECLDVTSGAITSGTTAKVSTEVVNAHGTPEMNIGDNVRVVFTGVNEKDPVSFDTVFSIFLLDENGEVIPINIDKELFAYIKSEILDYYKTDRSNQFFCALDLEVLEVDYTDDGAIAYLWVMYKEYSYNGELQLETGIHIPTVINVSQSDDAYKLSEYWEPKAGTYTEDIKEKFPSHLQDKAFNSEDYVDEQKAECERQALEYFNAVSKLAEELPVLTISHGEEEITAWVGAHHWIYGDDAIIKESNHPLRCMETMPFIPVWPTTISHAVGSEPGQVTLNFDIEPTKITVYRYDVDATDETAGEEIIMDNGYVLDLAHGDYLYQITAEWDYPEELGGTADYAFYTKAPQIYDPQAE